MYRNDTHSPKLSELMNRSSLAQCRFDSKMLRFYIFLYELFPLPQAKWYPVRKNSGKDNEFEYNFLIICRYLDFVNIRRWFMAYIKFTNCYKLKFWTDNICYFYWTLHKRGHMYRLKGDIYTALKGNNSCQTNSFRKLDK
jgi:hypothetical protein